MQPDYKAMVETLILSSYPVKVTSVCPVFMQTRRYMCVVRHFCCSIYIMFQRAIKHMVCYEHCYRALVDPLNGPVLQRLCQQPSSHLSHNTTCKDFPSILPQYFTTGILIVAHDHPTNIIHISVGMTGMIMNALSSPAIVG